MYKQNDGAALGYEKLIARFTMSLDFFFTTIYFIELDNKVYAKCSALMTPNGRRKFKYSPRRLKEILFNLQLIICESPLNISNFIIGLLMISFEVARRVDLRRGERERAKGGIVIVQRHDILRSCERGATVSQQSLEMFL